MFAEAFHMPANRRIQGHRHPHLHICVLQQGGFVERSASAWRECGAGIVRLSLASVAHDMQVQTEGAWGHILECQSFPDARLPHWSQGWPQASLFLSSSTSATAARLQQACRVGERFEIECIALELVAAARKSRIDSRPPAWLLELRSELAGMLATQPSLPNLAERYDRHRSHVARAFRDWFGRTIGDHARAQRVAEAAKRLRSTQEPLADLACQLGFTDQAHFTRVFGAHYGMPPAMYRRAALRRQSAFDPRAA